MWFDNPEGISTCQAGALVPDSSQPSSLSTGLLQLSSPRVWAGLAQAGWQQAVSARGRLGNADEAPTVTAAVALWAPTVE